MSRTTLAGSAAAFSLVLASLGQMTTGAAAAKPDKSAEPCAKKQTKVDDAQVALDRAIEHFAKKKAKVKKAKKEKKDAAGSEEAQADLEKAKAKQEKAKKEKRAQRMRLAQAEERLETCQADQEPPAEEEAPA